MQIHIIASGSSGNAYLIEKNGDRLLIEAGIPFKKLQRELWAHGVKVSDLDGCLISHSHRDHAKCVKELLKYTSCFMSLDTARELKVADNYNVHFEGKLTFWAIKSWLIFPFNGVHSNPDGSDCPCLGFFIQHSGESLVYLSDSAYSPVKFPLPVNYYMIGCNYSLDILNDNIAKGVPDTREQKPRLLHAHASLATVKEILTVNDTSKVQQIHLIHISQTNGDPERFKREIQELTGKEVYTH